MSDAARYLKQYFTEAWDVAKLQWKSFAVALILILGIYCISIWVNPGWASYLVILPPSLIVALTALARVNDIGPEKMGRRWQVRKIGLIMAGAGAVMLMATPFNETPMFPTWRAVILVWGFALAWLTTPGHPPWDYYISGRYLLPGWEQTEPRTPFEKAVRWITGSYSIEEILEAQAEYERAMARKQKSGKE